MQQQVRPDKLPQTGLLDTTVGRVLFNVPLPKPLQFVNEVMDKKKLNDFVGVCYELLGPEATAEVVDKIKHLGFTYATVSGMTIAVSDITVPPSKQAILDETDSAGGRDRAPVPPRPDHRRRAVQQGGRAVDARHR